MGWTAPSLATTTPTAHSPRHCMAPAGRWRGTLGRGAHPPRAHRCGLYTRPGTASTWAASVLKTEAVPKSVCIASSALSSAWLLHPSALSRQTQQLLLLPPRPADLSTAPPAASFDTAHIHPPLTTYLYHPEPSQCRLPSFTAKDPSHISPPLGPCSLFAPWLQE